MEIVKEDMVLSMTTNRSKIPKNVHFADEQEIHRVRPRWDMTRESMNGIWFEGDDFESFLDEMEKCLDKIQNGKQLKDKKYSALGLEHLTEEGSALRQAYLEDAWDAVLWEQHYQRENGKQSDFRIAQVYRDVSRDAEQKAICKARQVHREIRDYLSPASTPTRTDKKMTKVNVTPDDLSSFSSAQISLRSE